MLKSTYDEVKALTSQLEADSTNAILQDMFNTYSIPLTVNDNVRIVEAVQTVMANLCNEVTKQDKILDGMLVGVESFWDGTRVGVAPNEFDYLYVLNDLNKYITGCCECAIGKYRLKCKELNPLTRAPGILSNFAVRDLLCVCINRSMKKVSLPHNFHHGGVLSPNVSGVRRNGPAITLLFVWTGDQYMSHPLLISVDVTIAVRPVHLQAFIHDESTRLKDHTFQNVIRVLPESYLIADANFDNVWQRTTASLEVSVVSNMRIELLNTIKMLKILKDVVLTIREPDGKSQVDKQLTRHTKSHPDDVTKSKESDRCFKQDYCHFIHISTSGGGSNLTHAGSNIHRAYSYLVAARKQQITEVGERKLSQDENTKDMLKFANELCNFLLHGTEVVSDDSSVFEQEPTDNSDQCRHLDLAKFNCLPDVLNPWQCHLLFEDCKPLITIKSCVFKYVLMEILLSGEVSRQSTKNGNTGFRLDLLVRILKKIQKSKHVLHPLLGHPITTYSVSPRVQHCACGNRRLTQDTENRLSEILYDFLGLLITTLDRKCRSPDNMVGMTTRL